MSNDLEYKGYHGSVEYSAEDKRLFGKVLFVDSLLMYDGESIPELEAAFCETVDSYLAFCEETGRSPNKPYSGSFNVRVGSDLHRKAAQAAYKHNMGLNEYVISALQSAVDHNSATTVEHIHKHFVSITGDMIPEIRVASSMKQPSTWEQISATTH